jgi:hypothetical protein
VAQQNTEDEKTIIPGLLLSPGNLYEKALTLKKISILSQGDQMSCSPTHILSKELFMYINFITLAKKCGLLV